ncbi:MAG: cpaF1 [Herbinix sp.]|jgi:pilus assembly protein CpaF|nr:cpaF1 [Herbinix sp.]
MKFSLSNTIGIALVSVVVVIVIFFLFRKEDITEEEEEENQFSIPFLIQSVKNQLNEILNQNIAELYLNKRETKKRELMKARLNTALRTCAHGNLGEKEFIKDYIKDLLQRNLHIDQTTIDCVLPFTNTAKLTSQDKFDIILHQYKKKYQNEAFEILNKDYHLDQPKRNENGIYYEVTKQDLDVIFHNAREALSYLDKLEIVAQRIFQQLKGFGVIDELRDMCIDGISGGVSGLSNDQYNYIEEIMGTHSQKKSFTYDSIWLFFHGKTIHLSFLSFGSQSELIRVCKNLYRYDNVGHLTSTNGYKLTYLYDSSRVIVTRPKLTANWAFFIRKFDSTRFMKIDDLLKDPGKEIVIDLIKWAVKGCLNIVLTGDQGSGKTTALKYMVQYIDPKYPIRLTEQEFELWLNHMYPSLNIATFRQTEEVAITESIDIQKKTDGAIMILGEVASKELASSFITLTQAGTKATMCTNHSVTSADMVDYFRNALLSSGSFHNEIVAEEQVVNSIHLDIHWEKTGDGHRYISHITEIFPLPRDEDFPVDYNDCLLECLKRMARRRTFIARDLIVFENGHYLWKNKPSERLRTRIIKNLYDQREKDTFGQFYDEIHNELMNNDVAF